MERERGYRLVDAKEWEETQRVGFFAGSPLDAKDGFIHMSPESEVRRTCSCYYGGRSDVVVLVVNLARVKAEPGLTVQEDFVPSRNASFPHVYGSEGFAFRIPLAAIEKAYPITLDVASGGFSGFPPECVE